MLFGIPKFGIISREDRDVSTRVAVIHMQHATVDVNKQLNLHKNGLTIFRHRHKKQPFARTVEVLKK